MHLPEIVSDLALILIAAGLVTIVFRKLKQPVVLGYIIAGVLVGPHMPFVPTITDLPNVQVWAEIGVIFLLFALGLEFSFKKLARVGGAASCTAIVEIIGMMALGYLTGHLFGWSTTDSIFLGGILAISSTTIIIRAFEEVGVKGKGFVDLVFGVLIVEDLVAIVLMVLLATMAISHQFAGMEMLGSISKLLFFLILWFLSGIFLIPTLLRRFRKHINEETLVIVSLGLCFAMVVAATKAGFSPALGAFIMGSILAETTDAEKIEHLIQPLKNLFAAIFFVSVGMLIDPQILLEYAWPIAIISLVTIFGKIITTTAGALLAGQKLKTSVQSGFSLAQIGEFSFIIAGLGLSLGVTSHFLYPIAVAVSAITTFTTPYLVRSADGAHTLLEKHMPKSWHQFIDGYATSTRGISLTQEWAELLRIYLIKIVTNSVVIIGISLALARFLPEVLSTQFPNPRTVSSVGLLLTLFISAPFFWALVMARPKSDCIQVLWKNNWYRAPIISLELSRLAAAMALFAFVSPQFIAVGTTVIIIFSLTLAFLFLFSRYLRNIHSWFEKRFIENLSERDILANQPIISEKPSLPPLAPWDAHIAKLEVQPESELVGLSLQKAAIREKYGITIALIERGHKLISPPSPTEALYPYDKVSIIGTDEQIEVFRQSIQPEFSDSHLAESGSYSLKQIQVLENSELIHRKIRDSGLREQGQGLIVGLERAGQRILNPDSQITIQANDILWVVG